MQHRTKFILISVLLFIFIPSVQISAASFTIAASPTQLYENAQQTVYVSTGYAGQISCVLGGAGGSGTGSVVINTSLSAGSYNVQCASTPDGNDTSNAVTITVSPSPDRDGDGFPDYGYDWIRDLCPDEASSENQGCPEPLPIPPDDGGGQVVQPTAPPPPPWTPVYIDPNGSCRVRTTGDNAVFLRAQPSLNAQRITRLTQYISFLVLDATNNGEGEWYFVESAINGQQGWVSGSVVVAVGNNCTDAFVGSGSDSLISLQEALEDCPNNDVIFEWAEDLIDFTQDLITTSQNPCATATELWESALLGELGIANVHVGLLATMFDRCPTQATRLLHIADNNDDGEEIIDDYEDAVEEGNGDPCTILTDEVIDNQLEECEIPEQRWDRFRGILRQIGATDIDLQGVRGCELLGLLNLIGGHMDDTQLALYDVVKQCNSINGSLHLVIWAITQNLSGEILVEIIDLIADDCENAANIISDPKLPLPDLPIPITFECNPIWVSLLIHQLNIEYVDADGNLTEEGQQILRDLHEHSDHCFAIIHYLDTGIVPAVDFIPPTPYISPPVETLEQLQEQEIIFELVLVPEELLPALAVFALEPNFDETATNPTHEEALRAFRIMESNDIWWAIDEEEVTNVSYPVLSPNGRRIAYLAEVDGVITLRLANIVENHDNYVSQTIRLHDNQGIEINDSIANMRVMWLPDGDILVTIEDNGISLIYRYNILGERNEELLPLAGQSPYMSAYEGLEHFVYQDSLNRIIMADSSDIERTSTLSENLSDCRSPVTDLNELYVYFFCGQDNQMYVVNITDTSNPYAYTPQAIEVIITGEDSNLNMPNNFVMNNLASGPIEGYLSFDYNGVVYIMRYSPDNNTMEIRWQLAFDDQDIEQIYWDVLVE